MFPVLPKEPIMSDIDVLTSLMSSNSGKNSNEKTQQEGFGLVIE